LKDFFIRKIQWQETLPLRQRVLRPGLPPELSHFPGDEDPGTFHIGAQDQESPEIVGIGTFRPDPLPEYPALVDASGAPLRTEIHSAKNPYRLRGMAVHPDWRRRKIGNFILLEGERLLRENACGVLWFNARQDAFSFYKAAGYSEVSELFSINGVGPHKVMLKTF